MAVEALRNLPRFLRTACRLKPAQIGWRLRYLVQRRLESQAWFRLSDRIERRLDGIHAGPSRPHFLAPPISSAPPLDRLSELRQGRLTLLNEQRSFAGGADWRIAGEKNRHRLWNFTLHGHEWLRDLAASYAASREPACLDELRRRLADWLETCRLGAPGFAASSWNSSIIGQRLWYWREIAALVPSSFWNHELPLGHWRHSIAQQAEYLSRHIAWDLRGHHLFKNAIGLAAAADLLVGDGPKRWQELAKDIALSQLREQILPDGMHFERSPMYHIQVLEDLLALHTLLPDQDVRNKLQDACRRMAEPVRWLCHPCGRFPLFNDAADRHVSLPREMLAALTLRHLCREDSVPQGLKHFSQAGLVAWQGSPWTIFFDVGPISPDCQSGHAHADSLTIEASFDGRPLIVDPGTYCYDDDGNRKYDRSTKAHNTICLNDADSSEVWHISRVGRRAVPGDVSVAERGNGFSATAKHNGYEHLRGSPQHRRDISLSGKTLEIRDELIGEGQFRAEGGFLLAPEWTAEVLPAGWLLRHTETRLRVEIRPQQSIEFDVVSRPWHPEFGREVPTQRLVWSGNITLPFRLTTVWGIADGG